MVGKIFMTVLLAFGIINPSLFIKITEFWKFNRNAPTEKVLVATRILCVVAILLMDHVISVNKLLRFINK